MRVGTRVINRNSINTYSMCQECTVRVRTALIDQIVPSLSESKVERDVAAIISKCIYKITSITFKLIFPIETWCVHGNYQTEIEGNI
jgi:hypothetical protein